MKGIKSPYLWQQIVATLLIIFSLVTYLSLVWNGFINPWRLPVLIVVLFTVTLFWQYYLAPWGKTLLKMPKIAWVWLLITSIAVICGVINQQWFVMPVVVVLGTTNQILLWTLYSRQKRLSASDSGGEVQENWV